MYIWPLSCAAMHALPEQYVHTLFELLICELLKLVQDQLGHGTHVAGALEPVGYHRVRYLA